MLDSRLRTTSPALRTSCSWRGGSFTSTWEDKSLAKQSKINDIFKRREEDVSDNRSLNSSSSKYEGLNHFTVNKTNDADPSKPSSPEMHNISQESFSLSELKKKMHKESSTLVIKRNTNWSKTESLEDHSHSRRTKINSRKQVLPASVVYSILVYLLWWKKRWSVLPSLSSLFS